MKHARGKVREEARRLFLAGEVDTNAEIAARLRVKLHTVARWRKDEGWDGLWLMIDRKAAELFVLEIRLSSWLQDGGSVESISSPACRLQPMYRSSGRAPPA